MITEISNNLVKIKSFLWSVLFTALIISVCRANDPVIHSYKVTVSDDLKSLSVSAKFGAADFYRLYANSQKSAECTYDMHLENQALKPTDSSLRLRQNGSKKTLSYKFDLSKAPGKTRRSDSYKVNNDLFIPPGMWLWRPANLGADEYIEVEFDLPKGVNVSVPWRKIAENCYRLNHTPHDWPTAGAIGRFKVDSIKTGGCSIGVAYLDGDYKTSKEELNRWLSNAVDAVCKVYGSFPRKNAQFILIPVGKSREAVPFAQVVRGGGFSVKFYIDPNRPVEEFISDWTATHELSHSLLPFIDREQAWLSEGLATYYQYVLMGRDGRLSEQQAWQRIYNGFQKGVRNSKGLSLKTTAENMHKNHSYRYVYWSGAALMLKSDVLLRLKTGGKLSLDSILEKCHSVVLPETRTWGGKEMLDEMDRISGTTIFSDIYDEHIYQKDFPVNNSWLKELGIFVDNGNIILSDDAPLAEIRKAIINKSEL